MDISATQVWEVVRKDKALRAKVVQKVAARRKKCLKQLTETLPIRQAKAKKEQEEREAKLAYMYIPQSWLKRLANRFKRGGC